jgi:hypothetical protein
VAAERQVALVAAGQALGRQQLLVVVEMQVVSAPAEFVDFWFGASSGVVLRAWAKYGDRYIHTLIYWLTLLKRVASGVSLFIKRHGKL